MNTLLKRPRSAPAEEQYSPALARGADGRLWHGLGAEAGGHGDAMFPLVGARPIRVATR